jgi:hypothetical protein
MRRSHKVPMQELMYGAHDAATGAIQSGGGMKETYRIEAMLGRVE